MTFATTEDNIAASGEISRGFSDFPTEIVRLVFEASVTPGRRAVNDQQRQRSAHACCLVSKEVKAWVEPLLYEKVVLESSNQVMAFLDTLESKSAEFLARAVKAVWILDGSFTDDAVDRFHPLFSKCLSLENLACIGSEPCIRILQNIPKPREGQYKLRELTIMQPDYGTAYQLSLRYLSIQKLQPIDSSGKFLNILLKRFSIDVEFLNALRAIPRIYFDLVHAPNVFFSNLMLYINIHLLLPSTPEATNMIYIRVGHMNHRNEIQNGVDDWIRSWSKRFDLLVQASGHRLHVSGVGNNRPTIDLDLERTKSWIGLE